MDNPNVIIKETENIGKGLFAIKDIKKDEIIADWTGGRVYTAESANKLPNKLPENIRDHAVQFEEHKWIDTSGIGRYSNHSCNPNSGFNTKFHLVAMRDIKKGEQLTWDYEMTEDSDWRMECRCGNLECRKIIGAYKNMPESIREKYKGYISEWLIEKYRKN